MQHWDKIIFKADRGQVKFLSGPGGTIAPGFKYDVKVLEDPNSAVPSLLEKVANRLNELVFEAETHRGINRPVGPFDIQEIVDVEYAIVCAEKGPANNNNR